MDRVRRDRVQRALRKLAVSMVESVVTVAVVLLIGWVVLGFFNNEPSRIANIEPSRRIPYHTQIDQSYPDLFPIEPSDVYPYEPSSDDFRDMPSSGGCGIAAYGPGC